MTPNPSTSESRSPFQADDEDIVITGLSGLFPACNSVKEFSEKLYKHENLVTNDLRWEYENPELTKYCGTVAGLDKFDAQFFKVHYRSAKTMDCMSRKILEHAYQAIFDAGVSPNVFSGTKLGVFVATASTEMLTDYSELTLTGTSKALFANRISFMLNATGPSVMINSACSGSMVCLEKAYQAMRDGECEAAIVAGAHVNLVPQSCIHYGRMFRVNSDGKTKSFDKNADGQSPSECISVIFLQKAKVAKRVYATVCNVKAEFSLGLSENDFLNHYGPYRDSSILTNFFKEFYRNTNVSPLDIEYVEAFGSAFPEADKQELEAIQNVFCKNRVVPLFIGSVMSNMGFSQASSTVAALTKVCLAYQTGVIPANLHYETAHDVPALMDGRIRVVTENESFSRSYTAINNLSFNGMNGHVLLNGRYKLKDTKRYESKIPYIVAVSGRQESAVTMIFDDLKSHPIDPEEIALFHNIYKIPVVNHLTRGFTILTTDENQNTVSVKERVDHYDEAKRPLWFVFSGMGSQWSGMGKDLMRVPIFAAAIQRCHEVLQPKGLNLLHILMTDDKKIFDNVMNSFVGIAAIQIGLTDLLLGMGLVPDYIIGHSVGELPCAYADGCLSAEEVILSAYYRGLVSEQTPMIKGAMAAVGLGWQQVQTMCPPTVEVACHNSADSSTISGPIDDVHDFVESLIQQGIFAKEVDCSHKAYHSRYIKEAGPAFLQHLKTVIKNPKPRSNRWLSTSVPKSRWEEPEVQICSAEYHTNNLLNPVLFEETCIEIPANAVLIEVAPHGLLQAILKSALPSACTNIPLTRRAHFDNAQYLLEAIGDLCMVGYNPDLSVLYPEIEFPVSTETRSLSHLLVWAHNETWNLPIFNENLKKHASAYDVALSTHDDEFSFLRGHIIDDVTLFPFAGALVMVWDTLAMITGSAKKKLSVQFNEIHFHTQPQLSDNSLMKLSVEIQRGSGRFEVVNENILIATGFITTETEKNSSVDKKEREYKEKVFGKMVYSSNDVYRMFYDRGYGYRGEFRSIQLESADMTCANVSWNNNWVNLIDAVIQMNLLRRAGNFIEQPRFIQQLHIDVNQHDLVVQSLKDGLSSLKAFYYEENRVTRCGGVVLENLLFSNIRPNKRHRVGLKTLQFLPHFKHDVVDITAALNIILQIIEENKDSTMNALDFTERENGSFLGNKIKELLPELSSIKVNIQKMTKTDVFKPKTEEVPDFILVDNLLTDKINDMLADAIKNEIFLIVFEENSFSQSLYKVVASFITPTGRLVLGRWRPQRSNNIPTVVSVTSSHDIQRLKSTRSNLHPNGSLHILSQYPPINELKSLVKQWRKEKKNNKVYLAMIDSTSIQKLEAKQLPNFDLAYNVLHNDTWGGHYFTSVEKDKQKQQENAVSLRSEIIGDIDSLHWAKAEELNPKDVLITVHYAGLSLYDAKKANGDIIVNPADVYTQYYGMDFSGVTARGERVMGIVRGGAAADHVAAEPSLLWPVPKHWTLEDAATVPLAYAQAFYCFGIKCELKPDMNVLVYGGAGALGQAAISIALANGCTVFTTVSDLKKKRFLMEMFPTLRENFIGNSRDNTFGDIIMEATKGVGCHIVIISYAKRELKNIILNCCAANGTTLDMQEAHSKKYYLYGMYNMTKCRSYVVTDFSTVFENFAEFKKLQVMVSDGIARGYVRPLSRVVYGALDSGRALKLLAASRHRGKVLLHIHKEALAAINRLAVQPTCSNIVIAAAAADALAVGMVELLIARGAVNIILHQLKNEECQDNIYLVDKIKHWQKLGVNLKKSIGTLRGIAKIKELIRSCNSLGLVDGIYVITDDLDETDAEMISSLLDDLDNVTRATDFAVRHFTIINNNTDLGHDICINRNLEKLPALMLKIQNFEKFNEKNENVTEIFTTNNSVSLRSAMPYVEMALCLAEPVAVIHTRNQEASLLDKVLLITNLNIQFESNDKTTLQELGLQSRDTRKLLQLLQKYNPEIKKEEVPLMTLSELKDLEKKELKFRKNTGLDVLCSNIETDEVLAASELNFLSTSLQSVTEICDIDFELSYLIMVPGMDGYGGKFKSLCKQLKLPATFCQLGFDHPYENIRQMAERLIKIVLKKICPKEKFYLLGYSFGVLVALEMAAILEQRGLTGVVFCVDAGPDTFPTAVDTWLREAGVTDDAKLQNAVVQHTYFLMRGKSSNRLVSDLQKAKSWNERIGTGLRLLKNVGHTTQYIRNVIETIYARIIHTRQYDSTKLSSLRSQLVLLRCQSNSSVSPNLGLSQYSKQKPHVYNLAADHANALEDLRCAAIVNRHLDESILNDFNKRNMCRTYLITDPRL